MCIRWATNTQGVMHLHPEKAICLVPPESLPFALQHCGLEKGSVAELQSRLLNLQQRAIKRPHQTPGCGTEMDSADQPPVLSPSPSLPSQKKRKECWVALTRTQGHRSNQRIKGKKQQWRCTCNEQHINKPTVHRNSSQDLCLAASSAVPTLPERDHCCPTQLPFENYKSLLGGKYSWMENEGRLPVAKLAIKKVIISYKSTKTLGEQRQDRQVEEGEGSPAGFESHTHPQQLSEEPSTAHNALLSKHMWRMTGKEEEKQSRTMAATPACTENKCTSVSVIYWTQGHICCLTTWVFFLFSSSGGIFEFLKHLLQGIRVCLYLRLHLTRCCWPLHPSLVVEGTHNYLCECQAFT